MSKKSRKRKLEGEEQSVDDWERENVLPDEAENEMRTMWEIPQIFHFLCLTREALSIQHLSMYEMERMLLMPRASKQLANIMTSLLSSSISKSKLRKIPPMPYEFWTNILVHKMKKWFKIYDGKHRDPVKVLETTGIEPEFWNVFPEPCLLEGLNFEDLSFRQRAWLLKTVCDTVMHTRKTVQEEMAKQAAEDQGETVLGSDRHGARYIYFPQFLKSDLRIYRHCFDNKILSTVKPVKPRSKPVIEDDTPVVSTRQKHRRKKSHSSEDSTQSDLNNKNEDKCPSECKCSGDSATGSLANEDTNLSSASTCSNNNNNNSISMDGEKRPRSSSKTSDRSAASTETDHRKSSGYDTSFEEDPTERASQKMFKGFSSSGTNHCNIEILNGILNGLRSEIADERRTNEPEVSNRNNRAESTERSLDNLSSSSKTDDEKLNEIIGADCSKLAERNSSGVQQSEEELPVSSTSKSDDEKLSETKAEAKQKSRWFPVQGGDSEKSSDSVNSDGSECSSEPLRDEEERDVSLNELRSLLQKEAGEFELDKEAEARYSLRKSREARVCTSRRDDGFNEMLTELGSSEFQLVADSVESLRDLLSSLQSNEDRTKRGSVPPSEVKLVRRLKELLCSLEKIEPALRESVRKARSKMQKEWTNFMDGDVHCQQTTTQRYKRYRNLPFPHLAPKTSPTISPTIIAQTKTAPGTMATNSQTKKPPEVGSKRRKKRPKKKPEGTAKPRRKTPMNQPDRKKPPARRQRKKIKSREECSEPVGSHRTQSSSIRTTKSRRTSWKNGPTLRQSMRLPAHRTVHPLATLLRKPDTLTAGHPTRRTQTRIGFYRALAKGKINVRVPVED